MKIHHSIAYLLNCIYSILDLEGEVHSIWDCWISGLQGMQGQWFFRSRASGQQFSVKYKNTGYCGRMATPAQIYLPRKVCEGEFNVPPNDVDGTDPLTMLQIIHCIDNKKRYVIWAPKIIKQMAMAMIQTW